MSLVVIHMRNAFEDHHRDFSASRKKIGKVPPEIKTDQRCF
jgi:hypothetical protein